ncbi:MAG: hypothetical protein K2G55_12425 [Lachnospiraceae bacterium]|nr:hypothetical protein [Lachnospiraceae bacterium]MDE7201717.1 hypothetical protein [Lachnospiraceae bacterium]
MALTQLQKLELNKRVDRIFHVPSNAPANGHQPEIAFVTDMSGDMESIHSSVKDAVASLKAHDKMFQNMRSNMVYWDKDKIASKVTPMSFILMGKAFDSALLFDDSKIVGNLNKDVDKSLNFEELCAYLKLYHARCRCILVFVDCSYEELEMQEFYITDTDKAKQQLNPFLKYRLLIITKNKMMTGSELMMRLIKDNKSITER